MQNSRISDRRKPLPAQTVRHRLRFPGVFSPSSTTTLTLVFLTNLLCFWTSPVFTDEIFSLSPPTLERIGKHFGEDARQRLLAWQQILQDNSDATELEKISRVNTFFNRLDFTDDRTLWQQEDYWATPIEFLARGGGDCEDFSIAKFFTLKAMGLDEKRLAITYVKALGLNQAHMVLTYYPSPGAEPLILDNLTSKVLPASRRPDLLPVYTFNGAGLWIAKQRGRGQMVGSSKRLKNWRDLLERMHRDTR